MFVAFDREVRVNLAVVTLGTPDRLWRCLDALRHHESRHDFTVSAVPNSDRAHGAAAAGRRARSWAVEDRGGNDPPAYNPRRWGRPHHPPHLTPAALPA